MSDKRKSRLARSLDDARNRAHSNSSHDENPQPNNGVGRIDRGRSISRNGESDQPYNGVNQTNRAGRSRTRKKRSNVRGEVKYEQSGKGKRKLSRRMSGIAKKRNLRGTGEEQIHADEAEVNRDESMPSDAEPAADGIEMMVEYETNASTDTDVNPDTIVVAEEEATENPQPVAIISLCVRCEEQSSIRLNCKHTICQRCERIEHWAANNQPCKKCGEIDSLKEEIAKLKNAKSSHPLKKASDASEKVIKKRCQKLHEFILELIGRKKGDIDNNQMAEIVTVLSAYLNEHPDVAVRLRDGKVNGFERRLTADEDLEVFVEARLTDRQRRDLVRELSQRGLNVFAPYNKFAEAKKEALMQTNLEATTIELMGGQSPLVTVVSVKEALTRKVREMKEHEELLEGPDFRGKIVITIGGDKGGGTTKLVAAISNAKTPNSPDNQVILARYAGNDDAEDMNRALPKIAAALKKIKNIRVPVTSDPNSDTKVVPVQFFLVGDTMFLSAALGHMGPSALYPCPYCIQPKSALKLAKNWNHTRTYNRRMLRDYKRWAKIAKTTTLKGTKRSQITKSVNQPPLFHIPIANICPPQMHIALGIGEDLFELLEEDCRKYDMKSAGLSVNKDVETTRDDLKDKLADCKQRIAVTRIKQQQTEQLRKALMKAKKSPPKPPAPCAGIVCMATTVAPLKDRPCDKIRCMRCRREFHPQCEALATLEEIYGALDGYSCRKCKSARADISVLIHRTELNYAYHERDLHALIRLQTRYEEDKAAIDEIIDKNSGECVKRLKEALKKKKVDKRASPTGHFVGNQMRTLLTGDGPALLAAALGDNSADREKYETLFTGLGEIQSYFEARFLDESEIAKLKDLCEQFAVDFKRLLPDKSITPKMHFLVAHVPDFAKKHRTLGIFSEQPIESLHAKLNRIDKLLSGVRDRERRMKMSVQHFQMTASVRSKKGKNKR